MDSKKNMILSWQKVQNLFNIKIQFQKYFENIGMPFNSILNKLKIKKKKKLIFYKYKKESIKNLKKIKLYPHVKRIINILKKKYKLAIVTSKDMERTLMLLKRFNIKTPLVYVLL